MTDVADQFEELLEGSVDPADLAVAISTLPFGSIAPSPQVRYAIACAASVRIRREGNSSQSLGRYAPVIFSNMLSSLKAPGQWERSEPTFRHLRTTSIVFGLGAIFDRGQCDLALARIDLIGAANARKLAAAGIFTSDRLLRRAATVSGRAELATTTGLKASQLEAWAHAAELAVVIGRVDIAPSPICPEDAARLLALSAVEDVESLAKANVDVLTDALVRANRTALVAAGLDDRLAPRVGEWTKGAIAWIRACGDDRTSMVRPTPPDAGEKSEHADDDSGKATTGAKEKKANEPTAH